MTTRPTPPPERPLTPYVPRVPDFRTRVERHTDGELIDVFLGYGDAWLTMVGGSPDPAFREQRDLIGRPEPLITMAPELAPVLAAGLRAVADALDGRTS